MNCWGGGAVQTASSGTADGSLVTKVNHFYNGSPLILGLGWWGVPKVMQFAVEGELPDRAVAVVHAEDGVVRSRLPSMSKTSIDIVPRLKT